MSGGGEVDGLHPLGVGLGYGGGVSSRVVTESEQSENSWQ